MTADLDDVLKLAREGDRQAFDRLYRAFAPVLFAYASSRTRRPEDAEDLVAQAFLEAMRDIERFDGDVAGFRSWLFRIAQLRAIDLSRQRERRGEESIDAAAEQPDPEAADDLAIARLERERLWAAVAELPPLQRRVLVLRLGSGLSASEIAPIVGRRPGAVKALQHRALANLAKALGIPKALPGTLSE